MTGICDAHLHLQDPSLLSLRAGIGEAWNALGLVRAVCNGTSEADWDGVAEVAAGDARILPSYGLHPWKVAGRSPRWSADLERRLRAGGAVIGEIGLDHAVADRDDAGQESVFLEQLDLAGHLALPVTIHCVKAWGRLEILLQERRSRLPRPGFLLHAYGGPVERVKSFAELGAWFSFSARAGSERATRMRAALVAVPLDRLLIETDAPALPPSPEWTERELVDEATGRRLNHPTNVVAGYRFVSEFLGMPLDELIARVRTNFEALFGDAGPLIPSPSRSD